MTKSDRVPFTKRDHRMIAVARDRGQIKLDSGQTVKLIAWRGRGRRHEMRVEFTNGTSAQLPVTRCAEVVEALTHA